MNVVEGETLSIPSPASGWALPLSVFLGLFHDFLPVFASVSLLTLFFIFYFLKQSFSVTDLALPELAL